MTPLESIQRGLDNELVLLGKLKYRNHNQHRRSVYYKKLEEVWRHSKKTPATSIVQLLLDSQPLLTRLKSVDVAQDSEMIREVDSVLRSLTDARNGLYRVLRAEEKSYRLYEVLSHGYFMPFALTLVSIVARMYTLHCSLVEETVRTSQEVKLCLLDKVVAQCPASARRVSDYLLKDEVAAKQDICASLDIFTTLQELQRTHDAVLKHIEQQQTSMNLALAAKNPKLEKVEVPESCTSRRGERESPPSKKHVRPIGHSTGTKVATMRKRNAESLGTSGEKPTLTSAEVEWPSASGAQSPQGLGKKRKKKAKKRKSTGGVNGQKTTVKAANDIDDIFSSLL